MQDKAILISPHDAFLGGFLAVKGDALLQLGRSQETEAVARQALRTPNPRYWIYAQLAIALAESGQQCLVKAGIQYTRLHKMLSEC